ncbi:MAG: hypothetical protein WCS17_09515, partial [Prevotella sp.]
MAEPIASFNLLVNTAVSAIPTNPICFSTLFPADTSPSNAPFADDAKDATLDFAEDNEDLIRSFKFENGSVSLLFKFENESEFRELLIVVLRVVPNFETEFLIPVREDSTLDFRVEVLIELNAVPNEVFIFCPNPLNESLIPDNEEAILLFNPVIEERLIELNVCSRVDFMPELILLTEDVTPERDV